MSQPASGNTPAQREVLVQRDEAGVLEIVLNRPVRRNAVTQELMRQLRDALLGSDRAEVGAVLLRGADGYFCSGLDLGEIASRGALERSTELWLEVHRALAAVPVPVVGCLEGAAINAGAALLLGCDLVVASESGYVLIREAAMGMVPWMNAAWLAVQVSARVGGQLALSARPFPGRDLHRLGIALDVVPDESALARSRELAAQLAAYPSDGARRTKRALAVAAGAAGGISTVFDAVEDLRTAP